MRSAICSRSTSILPSCCRPTTRATASTTSRTCCAYRRRCSSSISAARRRSQRSPSATRTSRRSIIRLPRAGGSLAARARRRAAARHARRTLDQAILPARRRIRLQRFLLRNIVGYMAGLEMAARARDRHRRRARVPRAGRRPRGQRVLGREHSSAAADKIDERLRHARVRAPPGRTRSASRSRRRARPRRQEPLELFTRAISTCRT